ncbi:MAG: DUF969 domain-containing protein [Gemmatimonadaceae bacterium]
MVSLLPLVGIAIVVVGFVLRFNPLLVVTVAGIVTGLTAGQGLLQVVATLGKAFTDNRYVAIVWLLLPVVGLLERGGLKERAHDLISRLTGATTGRVLLAYLALRQITSALGLTSLGGHAQMVRPLLAPMAEAAAERTHGPIDQPTRYLVRAWSASVDNMGFFFGEDIFVAIGAILLMKGFLEQNGIRVEPTQLSVWAIPTAIAAFLIHGTRLLLLDRRLTIQMTAPNARDAATLGNSSARPAIETGSHERTDRGADR